MSRLNERSGDDKCRELISILKGIEFRGPEELASFLAQEHVHFTSDDLIAFGYILTTRLGRAAGICHMPEWLARVFILLVEDISPEVICDPWAGIGLLIGAMREKCKAETAIAITPNQGEQNLGRVLVPDAKWHVGDPLQLLDDLDCELDVAASVLPLGMRAMRPMKFTPEPDKSIELRDDLGHLLLVAASLRLSHSGIGLFVVTPSLFLSPRSVFHQFGELGLGIEAALALPSSTFAPKTNIPTYLVVVRRNSSPRMFVAQLSVDTNTNHQIIDNLRKGNEGTSVELGQFVDADSFRGIDAIRTEENFKLAEKRFGASALNLSELATAINLGRSGDDFNFPPAVNTIYVPLIGNSDVKDSVDELTLKNQNYAQVIVDSTRSKAGFVARFLNSEFGKEIREQSKSGVIPKLNKQTLMCPVEKLGCSARVRLRGWA